MWKTIIVILRDFFSQIDKFSRNFLILREHVPPPSENNAAQSGFEIQRRRYQKSKTGVSVAPQKGFMSSKNFKKKFPDFSSICNILSDLFPEL